MKRWISLIIVAALTFSLTACGGIADSPPASENPATNTTPQTETAPADTNTPSEPDVSPNATEPTTDMPESSVTALPTETDEQKDTPVRPETLNDGAETDRQPSNRALDYEVSTLIQNLPRSDAVDCVWAILGGYWTAADNLFVSFVYQDGIPGIEYGVWESDGGGFGELINADPMGDYEAALTVRFPAREANEVSAAQPETTITVFIDVSGLDNDGKIRIKIESHGDGGGDPAKQSSLGSEDWYTYAYGGRTSEKAYQSVHE